MPSSPRLSRYGGRPVVELECQSCGKPLLISLEDIEGPFTCRSCGQRIVVPPIRCYDDSCAGFYEKCNGQIEGLSAQDRAEERAAAQEELVGGGPTGAAYDDYGDARGSIVSHKCVKCGDRHTARSAVGHEGAWARGTERCARVVCSVCKRSPDVSELVDHGGAQ